ncbi:hypothetical protein [Beduini massiliensis]|uniref:hypothetical protein n=1 Tax=Beduini massiliensis TaxID=1585974 RepID=UPI00059A97B1|nr:hypothetical protein [Beduini massiliensis]
MDKKKKILYSIIAFGLLFCLGLFNYYDHSKLAKTTLFSEYFQIYYMVKVFIQFVFPILAIVICHKIESNDRGSNLLFPLMLSGMMIILVVSIFFLKIAYTYYWLDGYVIITSFCLINIYKKRKNV